MDECIMDLNEKLKFMCVVFVIINGILCEMGYCSDLGYCGDLGFCGKNEKKELIFVVKNDYDINEILFVF